MGKIIHLPVQSVPATTLVKLPLHVLQVIADFVDISAEASRPFNLFGTLATLLGQRGWARVMVPQLWSPGRTPDQLRQAFPVRGDLGTDPFSPSNLVQQPPFVPQADATPPQYEIIHISARFLFSRNAYDATYELKAVLSHTPLVMVRPGQVRDMAVQHGTRLIILDRPTSMIRQSEIDDFARAVSGAGGPAVLVVKEEDPQVRDKFLADTYAAIVHNHPLSRVARFQSATNVDLYLGRSADRSLSFDSFRKQLQDELKYLERTSRQPFSRTFHLQFRDGGATRFDYRSAREYLHQEGMSSLSLRGKQIVDAARAAMATIPQPPWDEEIQGVIPLAEASEHLARAVQELERAALDEVTQAPRVLNANFSTAEQKLPPNQPLVAGRTYDLLVDIGPRWQDGSIVSSREAFPVEALPQGVDGHLIEVVFSTADFDPPMSRTQLWLPANFGPSSPVIEEKPQPRPGPVRLPVRVLGPPDKAGRSKTRARGRLCLYYENNLLQSAKVSVGLTRAGEEKRSARNRIDVDFRLTGTFHGAGAQFAVRRFGDQERKVGLNITLNGDGGGNHRILINSGTKLGAAWMPYDPAALKGALDRCRAELVNVFMNRKENGDATDTWGLNASNGKTKRQFELDIYILARLGEQLFNALVQQMQPESGNAVSWVRQLQKILRERSVIQIARTGETPRQYVWPWALLYSYALPNYGVAGGVRYCDVLKDWSDAGIRSGASGDRCPHEGEAWHQRDVLCPYGFWGLKHILEQPLSPLKRDRGSPEKFMLLDAAHTGNLRGADPIFGIGVTEDHGLDQQQIKTHLRVLAAMFPPAPAGSGAGAAQNVPAITRANLLSVLNRVGVGYFLCHGQTDASQNEPYLSLGPNPGQSDNWIYPNTVVSWARSTDPDIWTNWQARRPLVFINGCHTTDLAPGAMLNFVDAFATLGAGGIVGTEISIRLPVAIEMAQSILAGTGKGAPLAETLHKARWTLANKGNLLGLAYTLYGLADFHMES
jgi:hypothetical protein